MSVLPVIERELRSTARHGLTYNLRTLGALALVGVLVMFWLQDNGGSGAGARLFTQFHRVLFWAIWILVPFLTADCISRERREGTLPLLFLTPLSARDIVYAKGFAQGLRSFTIWLAVLPLFTVCFLGGGVDWPEVIMSALVNFSAVCLALGAGLVASGATRVWTRAVAGASLMAVLLLLTFLVLLPWVMVKFWAIGNSRPVLPRQALVEAPQAGLVLALDIQELCQSWIFRRGPSAMLFTYATVAAVCAIGLFLLAHLAAWRVRATWREKPASRRVAWLQTRLFSPILFQKQLRSWLRWQLQRNPIGWLEQRSWSGRLVVWSWFAIVLCIYSSLFANLAVYQRSFHFVQSILATLLAGSLALSAAGSFRRERETGVLELLLVAPLTEWEVLIGRVKGLWAQFLPAVILLCAVWFWGSTFLSQTSEVPSILGYVVTFVTLPVVGLYFSLAKPNFVSALIWTVLVQVVLPAAVLLMVAFDFKDDVGLLDLLAQASVQITVAFFLGWRLLLMLKRREFVQGVT
jgi:ABC-type transport system involved in multi-copper enzyme maturation permease subunit